MTSMPTDCPPAKGVIVPPATLVAGVRERLASIVRHAIDSVPFYASFRGAPSVGFVDLPLISKKHMVQRFGDMLSSEYSRCAVKDHLKDCANTDLLREYTSGSSGYPLQCLKTPAEIARFAMALFRRRRRLLPDFSMRDLFCFIHNTGFPSTSHIDGLGNLAPDNIRRVLVKLRDEIRPRVLHGNPMLLIHYARRVIEDGFALRDWKISFIESVSEGITADEKRMVETAFHTRLVNCYGCLECYNIAYECPEGRLHVNEDVYLETVDVASGAPTHDEGEIVITSLVNRAQPFVRYKTGDIGTKSDERCACGSSEPVVALTGKRKIDFVRLLYKSDNPALLICGYDIFYSVTDRLLREGFDAIAWYNVVQTELDTFTVRVLKKPGYNERFERRFQELTEVEVGGAVRMHFVEVDETEALVSNRKNRVFRSKLQAE